MKQLLFIICLIFTLNIATAETVDLILIKKQKRLLTLFANNKVVKEYSVSLGSDPIGPKRCEGDGKTPEGDYKIVGRNLKSAFHKSLRVSYPNEQDRKLSAIEKCSPGGDIMIHGLPNGVGWVGGSHRLSDWTAGCIAVTDSEIDEIWRLVADGTRVQIEP